MPFGAEFRWRTPSVATAMPGIIRLIQHQNSSAPYPQIQYWQTTSVLAAKFRYKSFGFTN